MPMNAKEIVPYLNVDWSVGAVLKISSIIISRKCSSRGRLLDLILRSEI
jgi:hypothetical protein